MLLEAEVDGLHPRVAFLSAGPLRQGKYGNGDAVLTTHNSPGMEDVWETNYYTGDEATYSAPKEYCANIGKSDGRPEYIELGAEQDGSFTVTNSRSGFTKHYPPKH
jgi:competence protein ComEC